MSNDRDAGSRTTEQAGGSRSMERVTVNLTQKSADALREAVELTGDSKTDVINRALQVYAFIQRKTQGEGALFISPGDGSPMERIHIL